MLKVEPFKPWEEQAAQNVGLSDAPTMQSLGAQMLRLREELFNLRSHTFHRVQEVLRWVWLAGRWSLGVPVPVMHAHVRVRRPLSC